MSAWAKRKAAVQAEADAMVRADRNAIVAEQHAVLAEKTEEEALAELDLPNPDEMQAGDDFSAFMKSTVPAAFRNRALRKLWTSDPVLANVDMLVDYGEDFTGKNDMFKLVNTVYRVGKGMLPDDEEDIEADAQTPNIARNDVVDDIATTDKASETPTEDVNTVARDTLTEPLQIEDTDASFTPRRRMRFIFTDDTSPTITKLEIQ